MKHVTLFLANFDPLSHFVTHPGTPKSTSHILDPPPIFSRPSKNPDNSPMYKFSLNCSWGFCQGVFCLEGFVRGGFCSFPLLPEYICYNRKLNISLNFMFHMYDKEFVSVTSHALDPSPGPPPYHKLSPSQTLSPLERDVLYGRPLSIF